MFTSGQSVVSAIVFSLITYLIGVPTGVKVLNWVGTMYKGSIWLQTPMLYALSFLFIFSIGGFTGIMLGVLSADVHLHDTYFVVAHFHYVMMGGTVIAALGGLHFWWPKMFGVMYNETLGKIGAALIFIGFNVTFFVQFVLGSQGMPRRYYDYVPEFETMHQISTIGSWILAAGLFLVWFYLMWSLWKGKKASANPWGALTLEWTDTTSPALPHNFRTMPVVTHGPYDFHKMDEILADSIGNEGFGDGAAGDGSGDGARIAQPAVARPAATA
jgi:cytochrome c oxidase subunit 1